MAESTPCALVIFDCDGVLVDSERISNALLAAQLQELGLTMDVETTIRTFVGRSMLQCAALIEKMRGAPVPDDFISEHQARCARAFETELTALPGAASAIRAIESRGIEFCVASSGARHRTRHKLALTGLADLFGDRIFSGEDVQRNKPAPDLFLHAATALAKEPAACLVVEDTVVGVSAGVAAGMRVVGLTGTQTARALREAGAAHVIDTLLELIDVLGIGDVPIAETV